jgi:hypothetical protein
MMTSSIPHANVVSLAGGTRSRVAAAFRVAAQLTLLRVPFNRSSLTGVGTSSTKSGLITALSLCLPNLP